VIEDKIEWDNKLTQCDASFLQSFEWGEVLRLSGQKIERVLIENGVAKLMGMLVYKKTIGRRYVFMPYGPLVIGEGSDSEKSWQELVEHVRKSGNIFFKFELEKVGSCPQFVQTKIKLVKDVNPMATMILDLEKTEEEILASFHQKTRYNINLAIRKNLRVAWEKNFSVFWDLMKKTGARDQFALHPEKNYQTAIESLAVSQVIIYSDDVPVATACFWIFNNTCYYLYGASDHEYRQLMAPYLVQWEAIKTAKAKGCKYYDLFGIAPADNPNHRYAGVTRFKSGFNGKIIETPGTFDLPLNNFWYFVYVWSRRLRGLGV